MASVGETYDYWVHKNSGGLYAIRMQNQRVTGTCGPLELDTVTAREDPSGLSYRDASWIEEHREEFSPVGDWLRGRF
jgi:hypothetical protein